jgi:hypothetical protein
VVRPHWQVAFIVVTVMLRRRGKFEVDQINGVSGVRKVPAAEPLTLSLTEIHIIQISSIYPFSEIMSGL